MGEDFFPPGTEFLVEGKQFPQEVGCVPAESSALVPSLELKTAERSLLLKLLHQSSPGQSFKGVLPKEHKVEHRPNRPYVRLTLNLFTLRL